jgi:hypothetical protein
MMQIEAKDIASGTTYMSRCLGELRQVPAHTRAAPGVGLQQAWEIIEYAAGRPVASRIEWRDVPYVNDPQ